MSELRERILKGFKDNIIISNLKEECIMKRNNRKQVLLGTMITTLILSGSFITVNASTNGQLVENIKDTIKVIFIKDNNEEEIKGKEYKNKDGENWITFEKDIDGSQMQVDINKDELDKQNMELETKMTTDENTNEKDGSITVEIKDK